jgi:hypothetical protein
MQPYITTLFHCDEDAADEHGNDCIHELTVYFAAVN